MRASQLVKHRLSSAPIIGYPDHKLTYLLHTDTSNKAVGSVLSQAQEDNERVTAFCRETLMAFECNYCATRKELLTIVQVIQHIRPDLHVFPGNSS